jgi:hypothetical protein
LNQLEEQGFTPVVPREVFQEMKDLRLSSRSSREDRIAIDVALEMLEKKKVKKTTLGEGKVDEFLIKKGQEGIFIATFTYSSASFFVLKDWKTFPTSGIDSNPTSRTGEENVASFIGLPIKFSSILVVTIASPDATNIPDFNVPFFIIAVADIPRLGSRLASIMTPDAGSRVSPVDS